MGVNQQIFERYVNGDVNALEGLPVQKQAKFRELRDVRDRFFRESSREVRLSFDILLTGNQSNLMVNCNEAIEQLDTDKFREALEARANYDTELRVLADACFTKLSTDRQGNKYDEKQRGETRLENVFDSYSKELEGCNEMLIRVINDFYSRGAAEMVSDFPMIYLRPTSENDLVKMMLLAKLFSLHQFFESVKVQLAQSVLIARKKGNSDSAIARALETDTKKLNRMVDKYQLLRKNSRPLANNFFTMTAPMKTASTQEKLFAERKEKPEYAFVGHLLIHQDDEVLCGFQMDLMREFLHTVNYCSFALAVRHCNEEPKKPVNVYLFKLRITNKFMQQYDSAITPAYEALKRLRVKDDLIQCVLYEGSKEFKRRVARARHFR